MKALFIFSTTFVWQLLIATLLAPRVDVAMVPDLSLVWLVFLADEEAPAASREREVLIRNLLFVAALGYLDARFTLAPRALHLSVFIVAFMAQRLLSSALVSRAAIFITATLVSGGVELALWWLRGLLVRFSNLPPFRPLAITTSAVFTGVLAIFAFALMRKLFASSDQGYGRIR